MHPADVGADLPQSHRKQVQPLEPDSLIGGYQHPPPLVEVHQVLLGADGGLRDPGALLHPAELFVLLAGHGGDGPVVHAVELGHRGGDGRQDALFLHPLPHHPGDELREQHGGVGGVEELLYHVAARALYMDVKALQLPLKGVQPLQRRTPVVFAGVQLLQGLGKASAAAAVHSLFQLDVLKMICHRLSPPHSTKVTVLAVVSTSTTR